MNIYDFSVRDKNGNVVSLEKYRGKTLLIINSATRCIFSAQYMALERLYEKMKDRDFEILDFPCNQFGNQAPGDIDEITDYCQTRFGVSFEQFDKVEILGENAEPLFKWLQENTKYNMAGLGLKCAEFSPLRKISKKVCNMGEGQIYWNFTKFLIDKNGEIVARFEPPEPVEVVYEDVNRLINGDEVSKKGKIMRIESHVVSKSKQRIKGYRNRISFEFFWVGFAISLIITGLSLKLVGFDFNLIDLLKLLLIALPGAMLLSFFFGYSLDRIGKDINQLCAGLEQATAGNLNYRLSEERKGPLQKAYTDFNVMAENLKVSMNRMENAVAEAERANQAKSNFLSNMSHEMRTPLNAVLGMDEMIIRESREEDIKKYAIDIKNAGKSLLSLINDILDLSKIEANKMEIIPVVYDLSSVINDLVNMISDKAKTKGLSLEMNINPDMPHLYVGDEIRIKQICLNILNNAVKYTDEGSVTMSFDCVREENCSYLTFSCADTGQGIKPEDMKKLFDPFSRIEEQRNRNVEGTGLGMSITKNLLHLMDSELEVESEYGKGSVFSFKIKQEINSEEPIGDFKESYKKALANEQEYHESFTAVNAHILVVDDVEMNLTVVKSFLKKTLIKIDTATSGREAIELTQKNAYDVIFVDHMMPDMDGFDTLKAIRAGGTVNADKPVVVLTANAVSGAREQYMNAGFSEYLTKPVDGMKLEKLLIKLLPEELVEKAEETTGATEGTEVAETTGAAASTQLSQLASLAQIDSLDVDAGIAASGGEEGYLAVVENFAQTATGRIQSIREYYEAADWHNYTIQVHALKSSARIVGDMALSELAKELEACGNAEDVDMIRAKTEGLLNDYAELKDKLLPVFVEDEGKPEIERDMLIDGFTAMYEALSVFDMDMAEDVMNTFAEYSMPEDFRDTYDKLKVLMSEVDMDAIRDMIKPYI